jgi:adenylate cyclase
MDRIWQWAWDRYGARYSWAAFAITVVVGLPVYLVWSFAVVAFQKSDCYVEAAAVTVAATLLMEYLVMLPGLGGIRLAEQWAAGQEVDPARALESTYTFARRAVARAVGVSTVWTALLFVGDGAIAGASESRLVQYAILGAVIGATLQLIAVHSYVEGGLRPARVSIAGDTGIGDSLPRSRPTFAAWSKISVLAVVFTNATAGAMLATVFARAIEALCCPS